MRLAKKILFLFIACGFAISLTSCGEKTGSEAQTTQKLKAPGANKEQKNAAAAD